MIVPPLAQQARDLGNRAPEMLHRGQQVLVDAGVLARELTVREAFERTPVGGTDLFSTVLGAVQGLVGGVFGVVTILILAFYMLADAEAIVRAFVRLFPGNVARVSPTPAAACRQRSADGSWAS